MKFNRVFFIKSIYTMNRLVEKNGNFSQLNKKRLIGSIFVHRTFYAVRRTTSVELDKCVSLICCRSSSRLIFVAGGSRNSNVFI